MVCGCTSVCAFPGRHAGADDISSRLGCEQCQHGYYQDKVHSHVTVAEVPFMTSNNAVAALLLFWLMTVSKLFFFIFLRYGCYEE